MASAVLDPKATVLGDLEEVVQILNNLQVVSAETRIYISEGSLQLRDSDDALVGAIRVADQGETFSFAPGVLK